MGLQVNQSAALANGSAVLPEETWDTSMTGEEPSRWATAMGAAIMLVFYVEGLLGSIWIVVAVLTKRKVWNVINIFIVSLCINDLLVLFLILVLIIDSYIWGRWTAGRVMCKLNPEFTVAFTGCSLWHSALIAVHRYLVVVHNNLYKRMSKKAYVAFVLVAARAIPFACTLPGFTLESSDYVPKLLRCILLPKEKARIITITMVQIVVPCAIVVLCYIFVFGFVVRIGRRVQAANNRAMKREIQITKMFGVIFLMIMLGFIPYSAVRNADRGNRFSADIYVIVTVCYGIGTCLSPLVYGVMSRELRRTCCLQLKSWLKALHLDKVSPCCLQLVANNGMSCFDTSNNMDTYELSTGIGNTTVNDNGIKRTATAGSSKKSSSRGTDTDASCKASDNTVDNHSLVSAKLENHVHRDSGGVDGQASLLLQENHTGCNEACRLLSANNNDQAETPPPAGWASKVEGQKDLARNAKCQGSAGGGGSSKGILFFKSSSATAGCDSGSGSQSQGDRSRETSNISNSQTDTIENESESAAACSEMSAFV